ncbi:MAG: HNH endonuclease [Mycoplasmataceae bacterium]|nr:HNH endonuclease [Mycoplasmataceae bacterium]
MDKKPHKILVASHIKPFRISNILEQYDKDNCLLLSLEIDALFDKGYISFSDNGALLVSVKLIEREFVAPYVGMYLDDLILNDKRLTYLDFNRKNILLK